MLAPVKNPSGGSDHEDVSRKRYIFKLRKSLLIQGIEFARRLVGVGMMSWTKLFHTKAASHFNALQGRIRGEKQLKTQE